MSWIATLVKVVSQSDALVSSMMDLYDTFHSDFASQHVSSRAGVSTRLEPDGPERLAFIGTDPAD